MRDPEIGAGRETLHEDAALNRGSGLFSAVEHGFIESEPGEREGREGQGRLQFPSLGGKAYEANGGSAESQRVDANLVKIVDRFRAQELAADLVMRVRSFSRMVTARPAAARRIATMEPARPPPMTRLSKTAAGALMRADSFASAEKEV